LGHLRIRLVIIKLVAKSTKKQVFY